MVQKCKSCGASVEWYPTESGKPLILNVAANPNGNVVLLVDESGSLYAKVVPNGEYPTKPRRMPHWATCPHSSQWRGKGKGEGEAASSVPPSQKPVLSKPKRPTNDAIIVTLDEIRGLYNGARVRPSGEVTSVMLWLRSKVEQ